MSQNQTHLQLTDPGIAGAIARPPLLFLGALALGFALDHLLRLPFPIAGTGWAHWIGAVNAAVLIIPGIAIFAASVRNFARAATPIQGTRPTRALVTTGIHAWSRNPIYLAMFLVYVGIGLMVRSPWILILTVPLAITIHYGVVLREEVYLERRFGDAYREYKSRVGRWV
jgi:protein-S-isoprenylcysteine O-methyltransferase Ste14